MWRLGGKANQFTFIGEHEENAPYYTVGQHDIHRLANGNLLYFDNGNISGGGITPNDRTYSRAVEYQLDESNKVATLVWEFRHTPDISAPCTGSVKRFANGNTLIDWGCAVAASGTIVTEVSPAGNVVFEMKHRRQRALAGSLGKQVWNSPDLVRGTNYEDIVAGQTYSSPEAGVSVTVNDLSGAAENELRGPTPPGCRALSAVRRQSAASRDGACCALGFQHRHLASRTRPGPARYQLPLLIRP